MFGDVDEAEEEEGGEEVEHPVFAFGATGEELDEGVAGEAEAEAVGDGPGEGDGRDGEEGGDADLGVVPVDFADAGEHETADENERGRGGEGGDGADERRDEEREEEEDAGDDGGDAGASACGYSGGGLDVAGDGAGAEEGAEDGGGGVGEEDAVEAGDGVVGGDEAGALGDGDEGADVVEEIDEEEDEDDFECADVKCAGDVEVEGGGFDGGEVIGLGLPVDLVAEDAEECGAENADEHGGADAEDLQNGDEKEAEDGEDGLRSAQVAEGYGGGHARDDDARVAKADEGDEETDAAADRSVELVRDGGDEALADAREGEGEEDGSGEEDGTEGGLPGDAHAFDDGVGEVGVKAHAGGEGEGVVGERSHEDAAKGGAEAGGGGDGGEGHAGLSENGGVHEDDVGHRDEGGETGEDFGAPVGGVAVEAEVAFQTSANGHQVRSCQAGN